MASNDAHNLSLREHFGDRNPPDISRRITACVACRKLKIKCQMQGSNPPCARCKTRGLSCTVNRSLQMLIEGEFGWKSTATQRLTNLEAAMTKIADHLGMPEVFELNHQPSSPNGAEPMVEDSDNRQDSLTKPNGNENHQWDITLDAAGGPAAIPASHVSERSQFSGLSSQAEETSNSSDLVTRGIISKSRAKEFFGVYQDRLDHYVYQILDDYQTFEQLRSTSPLLLAAICSVVTLHLASPDFDRCFEDFIRLCRVRALSKHPSMQDVQAYCIGAFWLSSISWNLVGLAVRSATEIQLHRSIFRALKGERPSYIKARLFYLVYVCDHHFSIPWGRPPMTRDCEAIAVATAFASSQHATENDARLISQVKIWSISTQVFDALGTDVDTPISQTRLPQILRFAIDLDTWRADWNDRFAVNSHIGDYPRKGVALHFYFAKLYLCSHVFRGKPSLNGNQTASGLDEIANTAVISATSILNTIICDEEMKSHLAGLPTYFITMITFASIFMLKMALMYPHVQYIHRDEILAMIKQVTNSLEMAATRMHPKQLLVSIATSMRKVHEKLPQAYESTLQQQNSINSLTTTTMMMERGADVVVPNASQQQQMNLDNTALFTSPSDMFLWENYDFLSYQQDPFGLENDFQFQDGV